MKVKLLEYTPDPERVVAAAARLCYSADGAEEIAEKMTQAKIYDLIDKIRKSGHMSPFEHVSFTFAIEGVSRVFTHQLVRHRIASYDQQSQRYVDSNNFEYITPESIQKNEDALRVYKEAMDILNVTYHKLTELGIPKEDARFALPNSAETKIVLTMNARSLRHFFSLRCCNRAQWEIRAVANEMLEQAAKVAPLLFINAGASCIANGGKCPEGEMSCGHPKKY